MRICDCVKNSVWHDPRVRRQINEYVRLGYTVEAVGVRDHRYNQAEVDNMPCKVFLAEVDDKRHKEPNIFQKIYQKLKTYVDMYRLIVFSKPDIIHANDLNALVPAYCASKKLKCGIIYDAHEIFLENPGIAQEKINKFVWGFFEKHIINRVDMVVSVSHAAADYLKEKYNLKSIMVVTNCVGKDTIIEKAETIQPLQILNQGLFYEGRGYDILVEVAPLISDLTDVQIVLRGFGRLEQELRAKVKEKNIQNLIIAPPVKVYELIPAASTAWVGVAITEAISLNFKLSVSNKLFEYAAAGLPVIMSDIPEHRYLNDQYHFGIVLKSNNPIDIAEAIRRLHDEPDFYRKCKENAKKLSEEVNWEKEFARLIEFEKSITS